MEHVHRPDAPRAPKRVAAAAESRRRIRRFAPHDSVQRRLVVPVHATPPARVRGRRAVRRDLEPEPAAEKLAPQRVVRYEPARAPARSGRLAVARAFPPPVQVRGPAGLRAALGRGRVAWRVPAPPDDVGPNRAGRSGGCGGATRRRRRRVLALGARRGGARVPRRRVTRQLVSIF